MKGNISAAIADDHVAMRKGLRYILEAQKNIKVIIESSNGKDLLAQIQENTNLPDICLLDIQMPILNGIETLKIIRKEHPTIKVIMVSMFSTKMNLHQAYHHGADAFLDKSSECI